MRRRLVLAVALLAMLLPAARVHAGARIEHWASAVFVLPERNGSHPALIVEALRMTGAQGTALSVGSLNIGFAIHRGRCFDPDEYDSCVIGNRDDSVGGDFRDGDVFQIDDDLGYAHLKVRRGGVTHRVTWRASADPTPVAWDKTCSLAPAGAAAGLEREADAAGRLLGTDLRVTQVLTASLATVAFTC